MARSWVGLTILACLPCMEILRSREAHDLYVNCQNIEECYEFVVTASKNVCPTRLPPTLRHKAHFPYESLCLLQTGLTDGCPPYGQPRRCEVGVLQHDQPLAL